MTKKDLKEQMAAVLAPDGPQDWLIERCLNGSRCRCLMKTKIKKTK